jgi:hypothetical protein
MGLVVVCFLAGSGDPSHEVISFPIDRGCVKTQNPNLKVVNQDLFAWI